jgi:hypothetical protein
MSMYLILLTGLFHNIHVSVCDISTNGKEEVVVTFKIFYDDLQLAMGLRAGSELPAKFKNADQLIESFIDQNVTILVNGQRAKLSYIESISSPPAVWTDFMIKGISPKSIKSIEVINNILLTHFNDQTNVINITINNKKETFALNKKKRSSKIEF